MNIKQIVLATVFLFAINNSTNVGIRQEDYKEIKVWICTGCKNACLEEIAFENGWITAAKLKELAAPMAKNQYGQYLIRLSEEK